MYEKRIEYSNATLNPATGLTIFDNGTKVKLAPQNNIKYYFDFENLVIDDIGIVLEIGEDLTKSVVLDLEEQYSRPPRSGTGKFGTYAFQTDAHVAFYLPRVDWLTSETDFSLEFFLQIKDIFDTPGYLLGICKRYSPARGAWCLTTVQDAAADTISEIHINQIGSGGAVNTVAIDLASTYGSVLGINQWYHFVVSYRASDHTWCILIDGIKIYEGVVTNTPNTNWSYSRLGFGAVSRYGAGGTFNDMNATILWDDLKIRDVYVNSVTVPTEPEKIFLTSSAVTVLLDGGVDDIIWDISSLSYTDETEFDAGNIKLRVAAGNTEPSLSGTADTLDNIRAGSDPKGRYLKIEHSLISDGYTQVVLPNGIIYYQHPPKIDKGGKTLVFSALGEATPDPQKVQVWNSESDRATLNWQAQADKSWITLDPSSGTSSGEVDEIEVSVNPSGLDYGTHTGTITITGDAINSPQSIDVIFEKKRTSSTAKITSRDKPVIIKR